MLISLAEVRSTFDPAKNQRFLAKIQSVGMAEKWINCTSPFATGGGGGLVGHLPNPGSLVLVCQPDLNGEWFYLATTFLREPVLEGDGPIEVAAAELTPSQRVADVGGAETGAGVGMPDRLHLGDDDGNALVLAHERRPGAMNNVVTLKSGEGKSLSLRDDPAQDEIVIDTGSKKNTSKLILGGESPLNNITPANSYKLVTTGPQDSINSNSRTSLYVLEDGRDIEIVNKATGSFWGSLAPIGDAAVPCGNVSLQSNHGDINLLAKSSRIFIECLGKSDIADEEEVIQIRTRRDGAVRIITEGKVEIKTKGDLDIDCGGTINMLATSGINMQTTSGNISLLAAGNINTDGAEVHLNSGNAVAATPVIGEDENVYGAQGVQTL